MDRAIKVTVIGAGLMGHGIGQVFAREGHAVVLSDPDAAALGRALDKMRQNLVDDGADPERVLCNVSTEVALAQAVAHADLVIEAVPERLALKQQLFQDLAEAAPEHAILASNTSVIPITDIGAGLSEHPRGRLVGTHWWNPPHLVPLVEVVRTAHTRMDVFEQMYAWLEAVGKRPVKVHRDVTGFIGNRLQHAMWREAIGLVEDGVCDAEAIDLVVKNSFGLRGPVLGPMENADLVGLELTRDVHRVMFPALRTDAEPSPLLDRLIAQGHLGMKAGQGLRSWTAESADQVRLELARHLRRMTRSEDPCTQIQATPGKHPTR
ncbi:3-hydroxyacyl-CoA dehydrogenase [Hylemonella gracilis str. Niagara R]|uniref:3-hydroxyacyl-CoA dehydrogenase n=1 Tax=Hylemonella gracilis str. Niagara R TaxID=1458275 RepID=A0A016XEX0_9BURK|nr:3-hydroxyacyl-CoA dehydrogenase family protein [Hylemonella gracilis]EYC50082.1 3-hydroxyacyl-CoA dehydrogenase [Hylemonella gracilis str. Niagara R]